MNKYFPLILEQNEKILWHGKPELKAILFFSVSMVFSFLGISALIFLNLDNWDCVINGIKNNNLSCFQSLNILCLTFAVLAFLTPFATLVFYEITEYAITSKRILIKSGLIGTNVRSIFFNQIQSVFIDISILDMLSKTGTVLVDTGRFKICEKRGKKTVFCKLLFLKTPYIVSKMIQESLSYSKERKHLEILYFNRDSKLYPLGSQEVGLLKPVI